MNTLWHFVLFSQDISQQGVTDRMQATILTFISYIGCGVSAIFLSVTLLTYLSFEWVRFSFSVPLAPKIKQIKHSCSLKTFYDASYILYNCNQQDVLIYPILSAKSAGTFLRRSWSICVLRCCSWTWCSCWTRGLHCTKMQWACAFLQPSSFTTFCWSPSPGWGWRLCICIWPSSRSSTTSCPDTCWSSRWLAGVSSAVQLAVCFCCWLMMNWFCWRVIAGVPLAVVIIVIAVNKDNYGLLSYGKFSDGTTDDL